MTPQAINIIGWIGTGFSILYLVPQTVKALKTKSVDGVATWTLFSFLIGNIAWVIYSIGIHSIQRLVATAPQALSAIILLCVKYKKPLGKVFGCPKDHKEQAI